MRKTALIMLFLIALLLSSACELRRSNPLDPQSNPEITIPPRVLELTATASAPHAASKYIQLTWKKNSTHTTGYNIYMGLAYNSAFRLQGSVTNQSADGVHIVYTKTDVYPGDYYFKVSATNAYHDGTLEGPLSEWVYVRVQN